MEIPRSGESVYKTNLPNHMIPAHFIESLSTSLPTRMGKSTERALPAPDEQAIEDLNVLPRTPSEELIASVWGQVLGIRKYWYSGFLL